MNHPDDLRYGPEHEWSSIGADGIVTVGITEFAQSQLGDIEFVELPSSGGTVARGAAFAEVESTKTASDVYAPCSGEIVAVNDVPVDQPHAVNEDPYGCWLVRIRPSRPEELGQLLDAAGYRAFIAGA
jgi:glycine cleavage system H protein